MNKDKKFQAIACVSTRACTRKYIILKTFGTFQTSSTPLMMTINFQWNLSHTHGEPYSPTRITLWCLITNTLQLLYRALAIAI